VPGLLAVDRLEGSDELLEVPRVQLDVLLHAARLLQLAQRMLETVGFDSVDHLAVHLDQAPVRVVREARVPRRFAEAGDRLVVEAEVEDRVHHPRHRDGGTGADRDEERVVRVAEPLARLGLEPVEVLLDLLREAVREPLAVLRVGATRVGRDRESRRDGHAELRHLREPDALASEQLPPAAGRFVEVVDETPVRIVSHCRGIFPRKRALHSARWR
jgi:hypothetical protein